MKFFQTEFNRIQLKTKNPKKWSFSSKSYFSLLCKTYIIQLQQRIFKSQKVGNLENLNKLQKKLFMCLFSKALIKTSLFECSSNQNFKMAYLTQKEKKLKTNLKLKISVENLTLRISNKFVLDRSYFLFLYKKIKIIFKKLLFFTSINPQWETKLSLNSYRQTITRGLIECINYLGKYFKKSPKSILHFKNHKYFKKRYVFLYIRKFLFSWKNIALNSFKNFFSQTFCYSNFFEKKVEWNFNILLNQFYEKNKLIKIMQKQNNFNFFVNKKLKNNYKKKIYIFSEVFETLQNRFLKYKFPFFIKKLQKNTFLSFCFYQKNISNNIDHQRCFLKNILLLTSLNNDYLYNLLKIKTQNDFKTFKNSVQKLHSIHYNGKQKLCKQNLKKLRSSYFCRKQNLLVFKKQILLNKSQFSNEKEITLFKTHFYFLNFSLLNTFPKNIGNLFFIPTHFHKYLTQLETVILKTYNIYESHSSELISFVKENLKINNLNQYIPKQMSSYKNRNKNSGHCSFKKLNCFYSNRLIPKSLTHFNNFKKIKVKNKNFFSNVGFYKFDIQLFDIFQKDINRLLFSNFYTNNFIYFQKTFTKMWFYKTKKIYKSKNLLKTKVINDHIFLSKTKVAKLKSNYKIENKTIESKFTFEIVSQQIFSKFSMFFTKKTILLKNSFLNYLIFEIFQNLNFFMKKIISKLTLKNKVIYKINIIKMIISNKTDYLHNSLLKQVIKTGILDKNIIIKYNNNKLHIPEVSDTKVFQNSISLISIKNTSKILIMFIFKHFDFIQKLLKQLFNQKNVKHSCPSMKYLDTFDFMMVLKHLIKSKRCKELKFLESSIDCRLQNLETNFLNIMDVKDINNNCVKTSTGVEDKNLDIKNISIKLPIIKDNRNSISEIKNLSKSLPANKICKNSIRETKVGVKDRSFENKIYENFIRETIIFRKKKNLSNEVLFCKKIKLVSTHKAPIFIKINLCNYINFYTYISNYNGIYSDISLSGEFSDTLLDYHFISKNLFFENFEIFFIQYKQQTIISFPFSGILFQKFLLVKFLINKKIYLYRLFHKKTFLSKLILTVFKDISSEMRVSPILNNFLKSILNWYFKNGLILSLTDIKLRNTYKLYIPNNIQKNLMDFEFQEFSFFHKKYNKKYSKILTREIINLEIYKQQFLYKLNLLPSKTNIRKYLNQIRTIVFFAKQWTQEKLIHELAPKIKAWSKFYYFLKIKKIRKYCDYVIFKFLWKWACRRHPTKSKKWIKVKYFNSIAGQNWVFGIYKKSEKAFLCLPNHSNQYYVLKSRFEKHQFIYNTKWNYWKNF